jgi:DNA-binding NtrC family response regulator
MKSFSPEFHQVLVAYDWPGNVRELVQALEKAVISAKEEPVLFPNHLPEHIRVHLARSSVIKRKPPEPRRGDAPELAQAPVSLKDFREEGLVRLEKDYLSSLMKATGGDFGKACRISGLSRSRLYTLLKKCGISPS